MSRDEIVRMAREAGYDLNGGFRIGEASDAEIFTRFAALVAAHERELCAKVCDAQVQRSLDASVKAKSQRDQAMYRSAAQTAEWNAAAIRARGTA